MSARRSPASRGFFEVVEEPFYDAGTMRRSLLLLSEASKTPAFSRFRPAARGGRPGESFFGAEVQSAVDRDDADVEDGQHAVVVVGVVVVVVVRVASGFERRVRWFRAARSGCESAKPPMKSSWRLPEVTEKASEGLRPALGGLWGC